MYYGPTMMIAANFKINKYNDKVSALLLNIPLAVTNAVGTVLSIFVIDRFGRRYLMLRSLPVMIVTLLLIAAGMFTLPSAPNGEKSIGGDLAFSGTILFLLSFGVGMSSTPWAVCSEVFPMHVAGTANSLTTTSNWLSNFVVAQIFPLMLAKDGLKGWAFVILAISSCLSWLFIYLMLPETANKTISAILHAILGDKYHAKPSELELAETHESHDTQHDTQISSHSISSNASSHSVVSALSN